MKVLVTGGLGYLGSCFIRQIPHCFPQAKIIVLDNLASGRFDSLTGLLPSKSYFFIQDDIRTFPLDSLRLGPEDFVVHLAALSRPDESFGRSKDYEEINLKAAIRIAAGCAKSGAAFFLPSSTSVYGRRDGGWIRETGRFLHPATPYAVYKLRAEKELERIKSLRFSIARFGTLYGWSPGITYTTAVNKFCWQSCSGQEITVWKTAWNQYRPYLAVEDASRFILMLLKRKLFNRQTYNAASDQATVAMLFKMIQRRVPDSRVRKISVKAMNRLSYKVSSKDLKAIGFETQGSLPEGIKALTGILKNLPKPPG